MTDSTKNAQLRLFRELINKTNDAIFVADTETGRIIDFNERACTSTGYSREELLNMHVMDVDAVAREYSLWKRDVKEFREKGNIIFESVHKRKDGTTFPVEINVSYYPINDHDGYVIGIARDVTERKKSEEVLRESEKRYHILFDQSPDGVLIIDPEGKILEFNDTAHRQLGYSREEFARLCLADLDPVESQEEIQGKIRKILEIGKAAFDVKHRTKQGEIRDVHIINQVMMLSGSPVVYTIWHDITERKKAEEKIQQSEEFVRSILDTVDEGFIVIDHGFRILNANKAYCGQVARPCDEIIGKHCYEISHRTDRPCYEMGEECAVRHVFETGESYIALHKHPDAKGSILYVETKAFPIKDSTGAVTSVIETVNNITERHLLEEEQLKTQKLEAIGTLAGGIAHDFNNLLQGVFGYISMAKRMHDQKQKSLDMLDQAEKALQMSVNLTSQLLTFSKGGKPLTKRIALRPVIESSVKFALSGSRVDYRIQVDEGTQMVEADEGQIGQVIQNLVLNAEQAMPMGGTITITAKNIRSSQKGLPTALHQGNYVEISIMDSGIGIPEQYLPKIFDPYFTTKDKGSGLGLATSYSIIKNHGGSIDVKSKLGEGTTFFVYLPAVETVETSEVTVAEDIQGLRKGRILLMDDEDFVRNIAGIMIKSLGHEVEFAENGEEAIAKYRESMKTSGQFDIVIMDLTIRGGMGGEEAIKELLQIDPNIKAIVSSGYTDSSSISEYKTIGFKACLTKPYDIDSLNATLNSLLD